MKAIKFLRILVMAAGFLMNATMVTGAQQEAAEEIIQIHTNLVQTGVRASRQKKLCSMTKDDLKLFVNERPQPIESFDVEPIKLYKIVIDASGSMKRRKYERTARGLILMMQEAVKSNFDIKFEIMVFNHQLTNLGVFSAAENVRVRELLAAIEPQGGTALYQSVKQVLAKQSSDHFALVIVTDGHDTTTETRYLTRSLSATGNLTYLLILDPRVSAGYEYELQVNDVLTKEIGNRFQKVFESVTFFPDDRWDIIRDMTNIVKESQSVVRISFIPEEITATSHRVRLEHRDAKVNLAYRENFLMGGDSNEK